MKSKKNKAEVLINEPAVETKTETIQTEVVEAIVVTKKAPGRPVVEGSERQKRLAARAAKLAEQGELKRGRPIVTNSVRQMKLAAIAAKKAAGIEIKRGRPKMEKPAEQPAVQVATPEVATA